MLEIGTLCTLAPFLLRFSIYAFSVAIGDSALFIGSLISCQTNTFWGTIVAKVKHQRIDIPILIHFLAKLLCSFFVRVKCPQQGLQPCWGGRTERERDAHHFRQDNPLRINEWM